jgi:hypothetical protein
MPDDQHPVADGRKSICGTGMAQLTSICLSFGVAKNLLPTAAPLTLRLSHGMVAYLEQLTFTHLYGKNVADTAERIIQEEIKRLVTSGQLKELRTQLPYSASSSESESDNEPA